MRLKGRVTRFFTSDFQFFFSWLICPQAPENNTWIISNFLENSVDIRKSRWTTGSNNTSGKLAPRVNDTGGKIALGINDTGGKFAPGINNTAANFATSSAGVVDTVGKFATGVNGVGGKLPPLSTTPAANFLRNFCQNVKYPQNSTVIFWGIFARIFCVLNTEYYLHVCTSQELKRRGLTGGYKEMSSILADQ